MSKVKPNIIGRISEMFRLKRLDRYIIGKFLSTYFFLLLLIITIATIFDFNEHIDKFAAADVGPLQIVLYYCNFVPYFLNLFSPLFVFIAVIFFTINLTDHSEIIAMKSAGVSFKRLLRPYMVSAALIAILTFILGAYVIPRGNVARVEFENAYIKRKPITAVDNVQLQVDTGVVAYVSHFDSETKSGYGFSLDKFRDKKLTHHLTAQTIQYDTLSERRYSWTLYGVHQRMLQGMREQIEQHDKIDTLIMMEPTDFVYITGQQETLTLPELSEHIEKQKLRGATMLSTFEVEYHKRFSTPFAAFILTIIGVALSSEKRKGGGMGASIGIGLALSFVYILFQAISSSFAINAGWPPMISVWLPNIVFAVIAFVLYKRTPQ